jgi:hypothetical protein
MFALPPRHILREAFKRRGDKHVGLAFGHHLSVVRTTRCPEADTERLAAERAVGGGHEHLRRNLPLTFPIFPQLLAEPAVRTRVKIWV